MEWPFDLPNLFAARIASYVVADVANNWLGGPCAAWGPEKKNPLTRQRVF
jgi:hypothetical protein